VSASRLIDQAVQLQRAGRLAEAADLCRRALARAPRSAEARVALAEVLCALGRPGEAVPHLTRALELSPPKAEWHLRLGDAHHLRGDAAAAAEPYRRALALDETLGEAWWGLGCALAAQAEHAAAAACFRRLLALCPDHGPAHHNLGKELFDLGQIDEALDAFRKAAGLLRPNAMTLGMIATAIPGSPGADNRAVLDARRAWAAACAPAAPGGRPAARPVESDGRLRVGYVSAFFPNRNWMKPVWGVVNYHDRDRFEVHLFSDAPEDRVRHGYRQDPRDRFHDVSGLSNADLARLIEGQRIDVLVDLNGYSRAGRLPLFALRPAPVQVAWFNAFATSGMDGLDFIVGDEYVIPPAEEAYYNERVVRVPGSYLTFEVTYPVPDVAPAPCLSGRPVTFGCLAPQYKITEEVVEAWARILHGSPGSKLILKNVVLGKSENRIFVQDLFGRFGVAPDRLDLEGPAEHYAFLGKYAAIDVALDTFPYNGGTTTMEALWQGVPVLTFAGDRWASRISGSLLHNAGLGEFVAPDRDGYVSRAVELARSPETPARLGEVRRGMRERLRAAPVCDTITFARAMERLYLRLWQRHEG
jgi:predicted O-linked N-acetylglucosamine transferase (SPINDLY family)